MAAKVLPFLLITVLCICRATCALAEDNTIGPGDRIKVTVLGPDDLGAQATVDNDGAINLPVLGTFKIANKTPAQAAADLKIALKKYIKEPMVTVEILQKMMPVVVISGQVKKGGAFAVSSHTTLLELIGLAGGPEANADLTTVNLIHPGGKSPDIINVQDFIDGKSTAANPILAAGDVVMIPEKVTSKGSVFVLGEVKRTGVLDLRAKMHVHEAIAEAGGITEAADPQNATITPKGGEPLKFDLTKALAQDPAEDKLLNPGDTIYIQTISGICNIYGSVNRPATYPLKAPMPITDALSMAGGYTGHANIKDVKVLRNSEHKSIAVNLAKVEKLQAENMTIMPGDTIIVPERGERTNIWQILSAVGSLGWLVF